MKANERKDQARKGWIKQLQQEYLQVTCCMYDFLASFGMHGICMCVFGYFLSISWVLLGFNSSFILSLPFLDNHGVKGFIPG